MLMGSSPVVSLPLFIGEAWIAWPDGGGRVESAYLSQMVLVQVLTS